MKRLTVILLLLALVAIVAAPVLADPGSIGRAVWARKCDAEMSVIVTESPSGVNLVECFLYYDIPSEDKQP